MTNFIKSFLLVFLLFTACKENPVIEIRDTNLPPKPTRIKINWLTDKTVNIKTKSHLSYIKGFNCDSVIGINYIGFSGEHFYAPINEKGQYISTIRKKQKLSNEQISKLNSIFSNKKMFENPSIANCYEPRLGFVYFKNNEVICQTIVCIDCSRFQSSAKTAGLNGDFNKKATLEFEKLKNELGFTEN